MKVISIVSPNGTKIAQGLKTIEVRSWLPTIALGEDLLIVENNKFLRSENETDSKGVPVAIVKIKAIREFLEADVVAACASHWEAGYYSWELEDIRPVKSKFFVLAARGIYEIKLDEAQLTIGKKIDSSKLQSSKLLLRELGPNDESAFLSWYEMWKNDDPEWATFIWKPGMSHDEHLQKLQDQKDSSKIASHFVPSTMMYAFVDNEIVGRINIRHNLNENLQKRGGHVGYAVGTSHRRKGYAKEMFKQALTYCKTLGLRKILVTCGDSNEGSWKVIEAFGGSLENRVFDTKEELIRRYWVDVEDALNPKIERKDKVIGYVIRKKNNQTELLVFDHDKDYSEAGIQVPAGTVDKNENFEVALLREIYEEAGIAGLIVKNKIDQYSFCREIQFCHNRRHVYCLTSKNELPDRWTHQVTGDGVDKNFTFHYYWVDLETAKTKLAGRLGDSIDHLKRYLQQVKDKGWN